MKATSTNPGLSIIRSGAVPVYEQIAAHLRAQIESGAIAPGEQLPGTKVLAKKLGVNHLTLRQALQQLEEQGVISMQSSRGTFVTERSQQSLDVALVLPNLNESSSRISAGVQAAFAPLGSRVSIFHYDENTSLERQQLARLKDEGFDGAIVFPSLDHASLKPLLEMLIAGYPLVFLDRAPNELPCWSIGSDNFRGGYLAASRLLDAGCRRPACLAMSLGTVHGRLEGYKRALNDRGLAVNHDRVHTETTEDFRVEDVIDRWLALPEPPDGIFFPNDFRATFGIRHLTRLGRRVPQEIKVIGFDNLSVAELSLPALTTIAQDFSQIGQRAAQLLGETVALPPAQRFAVRREVVPVELVIRESA